MSNVNGPSNDSGKPEVEELLDVRYVDDKPEYLVKWKGQPPEMNTWEQCSNLNCPLLINKFLAQRSLPREVIVEVPEGIEPYGFDRGLPPDFISMVTKKDDELYFLVKWKGRQECDVVPAVQVNARYPQLVIRFYESIFYLK